MEQQIISQKLSANVRARLLYKREIEIDAAGQKLFSNEYLESLIDKKNSIDNKMGRMLLTSIAMVSLLYLTGNGVHAELKVIGVNLGAIPGLLVLLSLSSTYAIAMATFTFLNSQSYAALIDQVVLQKTQDGIVDPEVLKSSHSEEWLSFKTMRPDFNLYAPVHIKMNRLGSFLNGLSFTAMVIVSIAPFVALFILQPYFSIEFLPDTPIGKTAKIFSCFAVFSSVFAIVISGVPFRCDVELLSEPSELKSTD